MPKYHTESFNVDHTKMKAPAIRVAGTYKCKGVTVSKLDIRFCTPNERVLSREAMHTIEHLFAEVAHGSDSNIIDFSPMGCGTGFYLTFFGEADTMIPKIREFFIGCLMQPEIPALNPVQCGSYKMHNLMEARNAIAAFLNDTININ